MAYTGRCWYCGSEDVEQYSNGMCECMECGMTWDGIKYVQRHSFQRPRYVQTQVRRRHCSDDELKEWDKSMKVNREKWSNRCKTSPRNVLPDYVTLNKGKKWYETLTPVTDTWAIPSVLYYSIALIIYVFSGSMLYIACTD